MYNIQKLVRKEVAKRLDLTKTIRSQDRLEVHSVVADVSVSCMHDKCIVSNNIEQLRKKMPIFQWYQGAWPIFEMIKQYLRNTAAGHRHDIAAEHPVPQAALARSRSPANYPSWNGFGGSVQVFTEGNSKPSNRRVPAPLCIRSFSASSTQYTHTSFSSTEDCSDRARDANMKSRVCKRACISQNKLTNFRKSSLRSLRKNALLIGVQSKLKSRLVLLTSYARLCG